MVFTVGMLFCFHTLVSKSCNVLHAVISNLCGFSFTELHRYGGGLMDNEGKDFSSPLDGKQGMVPSKSSADNLVASVSHSDNYHIGGPSQRLANVVQWTEQRPQKWKGPDKISLIYGDWIEDLH